MSESSKTSSYFVTEANFCKVGSEWNVIWNPKNNPNGQHALYYRTDCNKNKAMLHTRDGDIELESGKIYFIPAFSVLYSEINGEIEKYYIHFQSNILDFIPNVYVLSHNSVKADCLTEGLFKTVVKNHKIKTPASQRKVFGAMEILLADFIGELTAQKNNIFKFKEVLKYIEENYYKQIRIEDLAKMMNISSTYFLNTFKKTFHVTPKQYILCKRLLESQILLTETNLPIFEIAEKTGFDNPNYFSEFFAEKMGISASKFRSITK